MCGVGRAARCGQQTDPIDPAYHTTHTSDHAGRVDRSRQRAAEDTRLGLGAVQVVARKPTSATRLELPDGELERCIEVNAVGMIMACRAFVPLMRGRRGAHIMNVLSEFAWLPFPNKASYCISKAAAAMASGCLRTELRSQGIRVTDFVPPAVDTGLVRSASAARPDLLAREVDVIRKHAWSAEVVGRRIARAVGRPRSLTICGWMTRAAVLSARCCPVTASVCAAHAAKRMGLW